MNNNNPYNHNWYNISSFKLRYLKNRLQDVTQKLEQAQNDELLSKEQQGFPEIKEILDRFKLTSK